MNELFWFLIVSVVINLVMFIFAYLFKTDKLTDASYAFTFIFLSLYALFSREISFPKIMIVAMIVIWASRLMIYLVIRINKFGRDKRFDGMREKFWSFFKFWLLQGVSVFIILIPSLLYLSKNFVGINSVSLIGLIIFFLGLLIETISDFQKFKFITDSKNKNKWIETGLWKFSRHPNYLGEILIWVGIYVFIFPFLNNFERLIGLIGPTYIIILLLFISGIPILEKKAHEKWGKNKKYIEYKNKTGVLIPKIGIN